MCVYNVRTDDLQQKFYSTCLSSHSSMFAFSCLKGAEVDKDGRRKRVPANKKDRTKEKFAGDDGRNSRTASLRIGTGKKGRGAEISQRRGSLKRRNRVADKEAKAERALERRTVALPE